MSAPDPRRPDLPRRECADDAVTVYFTCADQVEALADNYQTRLWPDLTEVEWDAIRDGGFNTARIASDCYRHAYRVAAKRLRELGEDLAADLASGEPT